MDPMARPGQQGGSLADRIRARNAAKVVFKTSRFSVFVTVLIMPGGSRGRDGAWKCEAAVRHPAREEEVAAGGEGGGEGQEGQLLQKSYRSAWKLRN